MTHPAIFIGTAAAASVTAALAFGLMHTQTNGHAPQFNGVWTEIDKPALDLPAAAIETQEVVVSAAKAEVPDCLRITACLVNSAGAGPNAAAPRFSAAPPARGTIPDAKYTDAETARPPEIARLRSSPMMTFDEGLDQWRIGVYR